MNNFSDIIKKIESRFAGVHVVIEKHSSIGREYEISCFGLNERSFDDAYDYIFDLNDELGLEAGIDLTPIFYTREETAKHFQKIHLLLLENSMLEPVYASQSVEIDFAFEDDLQLELEHVVPVVINDVVPPTIASVNNMDVLQDTDSIDYSLAA